jgi:hypothetical protein
MVGAGSPAATAQQLYMQNPTASTAAAALAAAQQQAALAQQQFAAVNPLAAFQQQLTAAQNAAANAQQPQNAATLTALAAQQGPREFNEKKPIISHIYTLIGEGGEGGLDFLCSFLFCLFQILSIFKLPFCNIINRQRLYQMEPLWPDLIIINCCLRLQPNSSM